MDRHPLSPRLDHCPPGLPREAFLAPDWHRRECATVLARNWVMLGRVADFPKGTLTPVDLSGAPMIVAHGEGLTAYHNTCPHRGAELCRVTAPLGRLIRCPYHAFSYDAADGRLVSTAHARPTDDLNRAGMALKPVALTTWAGFLFASLSPRRDLVADVALSTLDHWPMESLVTGHRWETEIACNWKTFWENYSECLHCPGIHPELCDMVPIYGSGIMGTSEALGWTPETPLQPNLKPGALTWTATGAPCGPTFPGLTEAERQAGYTFVTFWPTAYVVAHVDYVRSVRIVPLGPDKTRLIAEWHFPAETLAQPGFDAAKVAGFAKLVMEQDGAASEMNQRGIASPAFSARLMPEEYEIHRLHQWLLAEMETP